MPPRQGIKSGRSKLRSLLSEMHSRKPVDQCEQSPRRGTSFINGRRSSNLIKSDVMFFVQSSPQKSNTVQDVGFDDRRINPAHDTWAKTPSVSSTCRLTRPSVQISLSVELLLYLAEQ